MWRIEKIRKAILDKNINTCFQESEFLTQEIRKKVLRDVNQNTTVRNIVEDALASALVPDDIKHQFRRALQIPGDGNCLFNCVSVYLAGNISLSTQLRVLVAAELLIKSKKICKPSCARKHSVTYTDIYRSRGYAFFPFTYRRSQ